MCEAVSTVIESVRSIVSALDPSRLRADDAVELVEQFGELERLVSAGRSLAAGRVAATRAWRGHGATSARAFVAVRSGTTLRDAAAMLQTAHAVQRLPEVRDAMVAGRLSTVQAAEISSAASADPSAVPSLLKAAEQDSVEALREKCRDVIAAAAGDEDATERIRRSRYVRSWTERDGAVRVDARLAPDDAAPLLAAVNTGAHKLMGEARRASKLGAAGCGGVERIEAYAADALCSLVEGGMATVNVVVSASALERGHTVAGEICRIDGVGPVSVAVARRLALTGSVKSVVMAGGEISRVTHTGRTIPAKVRTALELRDRTCVVPGCHRALGLEIDHVVPLHQGGLTTIDNLARLCRWHHAQKTHHGWRLAGRPGCWTWTRGPHREYPRRE